MKPRTTGFGPTPRYGHTLTLTPDGRLLIIGGCSFAKDTGIPKYNGDIRQLDTDNMVWTRPRVSGHIPSGRYGHSATFLDDGLLLLTGGWGKNGCQSGDMVQEESSAVASGTFGVQILDTKSMAWWVPRKLGHKVMRPLYNHSACKSTGSSVFIFGGFDGRQALSDFYVINIEGGDSY